MFVNTSGAANLLGISTARVRQLLLEDRIEGANKLGNFWIIPLFEGKIIVHKRKKGPAPRWCSPRPPAKTKIHINTQRIKNNNQKIRENLDENGLDPVMTIKKGKENFYCHEVVIKGDCRIVYLPYTKNCGGAKVLLETFSRVEMFTKQWSDRSENNIFSLGFV